MLSAANLGRVELYAFDGATAAWKRLTNEPTAAQVWTLLKFYSAEMQLFK